jgi:hypothetical protein
VLMLLTPFFVRRRYDSPNYELSNPQKDVLTGTFRFTVSYSNLTIVTG